MRVLPALPLIILAAMLVGCDSRLQPEDAVRICERLQRAELLRRGEATVEDCYLTINDVVSIAGEVGSLSEYTR